MASLQSTTVDGAIIHKEGTTSTSGTTLTIDYSTGTSFEFDMVSVTGGNNIDTFTVNNVTGSYYKSFILHVIQHTTPWNTENSNFINFTWASINNVKWPSATGPTLTTTHDKKDIYSFTSWDNGTTWYGKVIGQNYS